MTDNRLLSSEQLAGVTNTRRLLSRWCALVAFLLPLRLPLAYAALIPLILYVALTERSIFSLAALQPKTRRVAASFLLFLSAILLSSVLGIDPQRSARPLFSLAFFSVTSIVFAHFASSTATLRALFLGQTLAAFHSVLDAAYPGTIPSLFNGKVTESGQIAMTVVVAGGIAWTGLEASKSRLGLVSGYQPALLSALLTIGLAMLSFSSHTAAIVCGLIAALAAMGGACLAWRRLQASNQGTLWPYEVYLYMPWLVTALLVNLKRGPWLGVLVACALFAVLYAPRTLGALVAVVALVVATVTPVQERLLASYEHFTISGGRSTIWQIGCEMIARYPLGIGYHNSPILQKFSPEIPPELKHFHNNILNITAENGWLGTALFIWLVVELLRLSFAKPRTVLRSSIGCALISWQVAGLVEYNFGDSEVTLVAWVLVGLLIGVSQGDPQPAPQLEGSLRE